MEVLVLQGSSAGSGPKAPQTQRHYPGAGRGADGEVRRIPAGDEAGDVLLLCSDGLSNLVRESELVSALAENPDMESFCRFLLKLTLDRGAPDNVTVVALAR